MTNMKDWSLSKVNAFATLLDVKLQTVGSGYVTKQNIKEGTALKKGDYVAVELKEPKAKSKSKKSKK